MNLKHRNAHHIVFTPKYRRPVFRDQPFVIAAAVQHFQHICDLRKIEIIEINIQADHVHLFIDVPRTIAIAKAVQDIKWYTSLYLRKQFPHLKKISNRALWQTKYFSRSIGGDAVRVINYIKNQGA